MFKNERKRNANTYLIISNFDSLEAPLQIYRPRQLSSLPRPKYAPEYTYVLYQKISFPSAPQKIV